MEPLFDPVWISNREHLARFQEIRSATPWYRVLLGGTYTLPPDFPYAEIGARKFPLVYFSTGELTIEHNLVAYVARAASSTGLRSSRRNLNTSLAFSIDSAEPVKIGRFRAAMSPRYFSINWIELVLPDHALLLCVGGPGPQMGRIQERTNQLFSSLAAWSSEPPIVSPRSTDAA